MPIILSAPAKRKNGRAPSVSALASKVIRLAEKHGANHPLTVAARADFEAAAQSKERSRQAGMSEEAQVWSHVLSHKNPRRRKNTRKTALPPMRNNGAAGSVVIYDASGRAVSRSKNLAGIIRHARNRLVSSINVSPSGVLSIRWEDGTHVDTPFADPSVAVSWAQSREWLKETPVTRKNARKAALPPMRNNGEFYAQPYEQYAAYMYSVGKQPMVAWEWAEKQQAYYAKKAKKAAKAVSPIDKALERVRKQAAKEAAEREAYRAARAEREALRLSAPTARQAAYAERAEKAKAHYATLAAGIPLNLLEILEQAGVPQTGITLVVTPEGAVAKGDAKSMIQSGASYTLKGHGFTYIPEHKAWLFLGFFDTEHFRALADDLAAKGIDVRRVGFNPRRRKNGRKAPAKRTNGSRSVVDTVAARELELYIENERNLVGPGNTMGANIMRTLAGRIVRGTYDSTKAWKAWSPLVTEGAKRYKREHGPLNASKATRDAVATRLSEAFEAEVRVGALDPMKLLGARNNPSGSEIVPPLAQWKKGDYEYSVRGRKGHGNTEYVIRNFSSTGSAWVPLALYANGNMSVVHKGVTGTHFVLTTENALSHKYSLYDYATPGAARAALVKAVNSSILPHARSSRR